MNDYNECIQEKNEGDLFSYILKDNNIFYETGIKVLEYQAKYGLLECVNLFQNGHIRLVYNSAGYKSLRQYITDGNRQGLIAILGNLVNTILHIRANGFLKSENIDINVDKIFVNTSNFSVKLICLPIINLSKFSSHDKMMSVLYDRLLFIIPPYMEISDSDLRKILLLTPLNEDGDNNSGITSITSDEDEFTGSENDAEHGMNRKKGFISKFFGGKRDNRLHLINPREKIEFVIGEEPFLLGKDSSTANGVIIGHNAVSRKHCSITFDGKSYYVEDTESKNGTFVNEKLIEKNHRVELRRGMTLRLADIEFIVR